MGWMALDPLCMRPLSPTPFQPRELPLELQLETSWMEQVP